MRTITQQFFGHGMVNDIYGGGLGEFSVAKNFDIFTYPNRLFPLPSMQAATSNTGIGNMLVASDGKVYGSGVSGAGGGQGALWKATAGSTTWAENTVNGRTGATTDYSLFLEYKDIGSAKTIVMGNGSKVFFLDPTDALASASRDLSATSFGQGYVHPADDILYVPYTTSSGTFIASYNGATATWNNTALTLPAQYTPISCTRYGNYLAIACTKVPTLGASAGNVDVSVVFLWDRDTTHTWTEGIAWGDNSLQALNNLNGMLVGVSSKYSNNIAGLIIKGYTGGQPKVLKKILLTQTTSSIVINRNVSYIHNERFYFSVDLPGGGVQPIYKGLWAFGESNGRWALNIERVCTTDGSNGSVLAAIHASDYLHASVTTVNTATVQFSGSTKSTDYVNASVFESLINPGMTPEEKIANKQLVTLAVHYLPLPSSGQVILKYRVDSDYGSWTTVCTETTAGKTFTEIPSNLLATATTSGRNFEFRIESTGYAQPIGYSFKFDTQKTLL